MKTFKRNSFQETTEVETEIGPTVEVETTQGTTTGIEVGIEETTEITIEIEVEIGEIVQTTAGIERDRGRGRDRSNSRDGGRNQPRSGSGQRYFDKNDFCNYCNRTGHATHRCFRLENYLKRKCKRIILHDEDDVQEIAEAVQDLNTKINSLKVSNSTKN